MHASSAKSASHSLRCFRMTHCMLFVDASRGLPGILAVSDDDQMRMALPLGDSQRMNMATQGSDRLCESHRIRITLILTTPKVMYSSTYSLVIHNTQASLLMNM